METHTIKCEESTTNCYVYEKIKYPRKWPKSLKQKYLLSERKKRDRENSKKIRELKGGRFKRKEIYVYLWLIHVEVWQKTTQFCKAIVLQLKKK